MTTRVEISASKKVGRFAGPVLSALFLSEIVTLPIYNSQVNEHVVYLNGFVLLAFGFYLVTVHNVWTRRWPVLITLTAWLMTALGLYRLFFPTAEQAPVTTPTYVMLTVFLLAQLFVTFRSYIRH